MGIRLNNRVPLTMWVEVMDSGDGFSPIPAELDGNDAGFGRGLPLLQTLCKSVEFDPDGSRVVVAIELE